MYIVEIRELENHGHNGDEDSLTIEKFETFEDAEEYLKKQYLEYCKSYGTTPNFIEDDDDYDYGDIFPPSSYCDYDSFHFEYEYEFKADGFIA